MDQGLAHLDNRAGAVNPRKYRKATIKRKLERERGRSEVTQPTFIHIIKHLQYAYRS
jgi:hypothetical protein